jgi:ubiquitin C-terminal hydrolase
MEQMAASSPNPKPNQKQVYETTPVSARRSFRSTSILPNNITTPRGQASTLPDINRLMISPPAQKKLAGGAGAQEGAVQKIYLRGLSVDVGLENLGNTCFMNSILQCLLHIDSFVEHFMTRDINMEINKSSPTRGTLATSFAQLVADIRNSSSGVVISPANFQKAVCIIFIMFSSSQGIKRLNSICICAL